MGILPEYLREDSIGDGMDDAGKTAADSKKSGGMARHCLPCLASERIRDGERDGSAIPKSLETGIVFLGIKTD